MKILIADDHALMRQGLMQLVADEIPGTQFGQAATSQQTLELVWKEPWDLVILDINMPGRNGFEVLQEIHNNPSSPPVLVLSAYPEDQLGLQSLKAGAAGYVNKQSANEDLIRAIRKVTAGGTYVSAQLAEKMAGRFRRAENAPLHESLSVREFQVMQKLVAGKSVNHIAQDLSLSAKTISTFRRRLLQKLGLQSNAELVHYAIQHGLSE